MKFTQLEYEKKKKKKKMKLRAFCEKYVTKEHLVINRNVLFHI